MPQAHQRYQPFHERFHLQAVVDCLTHLWEDDEPPKGKQWFMSYYKQTANQKIQICSCTCKTHPINLINKWNYNTQMELQELYTKRNFLKQELIDLEKEIGRHPDTLRSIFKHNPSWDMEIL